MASPPPTFSPAGSPPNPTTHIQLARKRSTPEFAGGQPSLKRRKGSTLSVSSIPMTGHPLRQASFPPLEADTPSALHFSRSPSPDSAAPSMVSTREKDSDAKNNRKRGRKQKSVASGVETPTRAQTPSLVDGGAGTSQAPGDHANQAQNPKDDVEDEDDPEANAAAAMTMHKSTEEEQQTERRLRALLFSQLEPEQTMRYEKWRAGKIQDAAVKRVVNATVSQSVPANVVLAVKVAAKLFLGDIIEMAREVQSEWIEATGEKQCDLPEPTPAPGVAPTKGGRRAPLRPDHLAEAYRRYKISGEGGGVGVMGTWHQQTQSGVERFAVRARGKRLFK